MIRLRKLTALLLAVALLLGLSGVAGATAPDVIGTRFEESVGYLTNLGVIAGYPDGTYRPAATITRAETTKIIIAMTHGGTTTADLLRGSTPFSDVPGAHWASGFIALAKNTGIVNGYPDGTFKPEAPVTFAEFAKMLCAAAGVPPATGLTWPANWVSAAHGTGMLNGVIGFEANTPAPRGECAIMAAYTVKEVPNPTTGRTLAQSVFGESMVASITLTPASSTVAIGAPVQFVATAKSATGAVLSGTVFAWATSDPTKAPVNSTGLFVGSASGTYTVTASAGDASASATVAVYGTATALRATPQTTTVPANGVTEVEIAVEVIDATGVRVLGDSSTAIAIAYGDDGDNGAVDFVDDPLTVKNGLATFTVTASLNSDVTDTLEFTAGDLTEDSVTVSTVDQIATAVELTATPTELMANEVSEGIVEAVVIDQVGEPMVSGVYELTFAIAGAGTMEGETDDITRPTIAQTASVGVASLKGDPGTFTVTCSGPGLTAGTVRVTTYIAGSPTSLRVTVDDGTTAAGEVADAEDETGLAVTITIVDRNGHVVAATTGVDLQFDYDEDAGFEDSLGTGAFIPDGDTEISIDFTGTKVGTWTISVSDEAGTLTGTSFTVTIEAGDPAVLVLTPDLEEYGLWLPITNPRTTFSAQVEDDYGNPVAEAGIDLVFTADKLGVREATLTNDGEVTTDSTGKATVVFSAGAYSGEAYRISVETAADEEFTASAEAGNSVWISDTVPGSMEIKTRDGEDHVISSITADGGRVYTTVTVYDTNGNLIDAGTDPLKDSWLIEIRFANDGDNVNDVADWGDDNDLTPSASEDGVYWTWTVDSTVDFSFEGATAGTFSITATALEPLVKEDESQVFQVKVGTDVGVRVFNTDGTLATAVKYEAEDIVQLRVALVDAGGNQVVAPTTQTISLSPATAGGEYRLSAGGTAVTSIELAAGKTSVTVYYVDEDDSPVDGADLSMDATIAP